MKIVGDKTFDASPEAVWEALLDPNIMAKCIPGCQELVEIGPDTYSATLKVGVGAVSGTYKGRFQITDKVVPSRYTMEFEGSGKQGFVRGSGLTAVYSENGVTKVSYDCDVEIGGLIASVGQRVLEGVSKFLINQMFSQLGKSIS